MEQNQLEKALRDLAEALKNNDAVQKVKVTITLDKPKPGKATQSK